MVIRARFEVHYKKAIVKSKWSEFQNFSFQLIMAILGIGVDVVHIPRIAALLNRRGSQKLATRILSLEEFTQWKSLPQSDALSETRFFAVRYARCHYFFYPSIEPYFLDGLSKKLHIRPCIQSFGQHGKSSHIAGWAQGSSAPSLPYSTGLALSRTSRKLAQLIFQSAMMGTMFSFRSWLKAPASLHSERMRAERRTMEGAVFIVCK